MGSGNTADSGNAADGEKRHIESLQANFNLRLQQLAWSERP
jgi:hypothetical protein